jgi:hypothetical protein
VAAADVDLGVEVQGDEIVVTLPGTSYVVTYYRAAAFPQQLLTRSHSGRADEGAPMTQAEFHARAWKTASHGARAGVDCVKETPAEAAEEHRAGLAGGGLRRRASACSPYYKALISRDGVEKRRSVSPQSLERG